MMCLCRCAAMVLGSVGCGFAVQLRGLRGPHGPSRAAGADETATPRCISPSQLAAAVCAARRISGSTLHSHALACHPRCPRPSTTPAHHVPHHPATHQAWHSPGNPPSTLPPPMAHSQPPSHPLSHTYQPATRPATHTSQPPTMAHSQPPAQPAYLGTLPLQLLAGRAVDQVALAQRCVDGGDGAE